MNNLLHRLQSKLQPIPESGCHIFMGTSDKPDGYGTMTINGKKEKAHRVAWRLVHGEIPHGMEVLHTCDVKPCCNVAHLQLGSHAENMRQAGERNRSRSGGQKLTKEQVEQIRQSKEKAKVWAEKLGVSESTISRAKSGIHFQ